MKGIVFMGGREVELMEFPKPEPDPRDIVLEIKASGMCGTDLGPYQREYNPGVTTSGVSRIDGHVIGGEVQLAVLPDLIHRQITLVGHCTFSKVGQADCARFVSDRKIDVDSLFTHNWQLEDAKEAYQPFDQHKTGNGVFLPA